MNQEEREQVAAVINFFRGGGLARPSQITGHVATIAHDALVEAGKCTATMELVPRPPQAKPGSRYVLKQLKKISKLISPTETEVYHICRQRVQINTLSQMRLALMGH